MEIINIEEATGKKKSLFKTARKYALNFLKIAACTIGALYSGMLLSNYGFTQTLLAGASLGITAGYTVPKTFKKLKELYLKHKKEEEKEKVHSIENQEEIEDTKIIKKVA